ncbi:hypothetical protein SeMB42_g01125 [Synchytrium endobioticum]|uniref:Uncharacterized protein n=1 Tax=Synchytrium endobioticum TaxID=286115 RepID=A0A507DMH9_9FUNG|nr:hypothetical protein SeMB42_g01125 [Synchytrium endobioticum]
MESHLRTLIECVINPYIACLPPVPIQDRRPYLSSKAKSFHDMLHSVIKSSNQATLKHKHDEDLIEQEIIRRAALRRTAMGENKDVMLSALAYHTPGPSDYEIHLPLSGPKFSILARHREIAKNSTPPPTAYDAQSSLSATWTHGPSITFSGKFNGFPPLVEDRSSSPAPTFYQNGESTIGLDKPKFTISGRHVLPADQTPGPKYAVDVKDTAPMFSFRIKPADKPEELPSPTDYNTSNFASVKFSNEPAYSIRPKTTMNIPMPEGASCYYYPKLEWVKNGGVTLKGYYREVKTLQTPSPAQYKLPNSSNEAPQFSLTARQYPPESKDIVPAPTEYSPNLDASTAKPRAATLKGRHGASAFNCISALNTPSPSEYLPKDRQIVCNGAPKVTMKSRHPCKIDDIPGPSHYSPFAGRPKTTANALKDTKGVNTHNRGTENSNEEPQHQQLPHLTEERVMDVEELQQETLPGDKKSKPKADDLRPVTAPVPQHTRGYTFGVRSTMSQKNDTPSPNSYYPEPVWKRKAVTFKGRTTPYMANFTTNRFDTLRVVV